MQSYLAKAYGHKWNGSLTYKKVKNYPLHIKSAMQVPTHMIGIHI